MPGLAARLIVYGFIGAFGLVGVLFLLIAAQATVQSGSFLHDALRAEGTVIELRPVRTTRTGAGTVIPFFRFTAADGRDYVGISATSVRGSALKVGDRVGVLYLRDHPETARLNRFSALWIGSLVFGIVGASFAAVAAFAIAAILRMRRSQAAP
jgi:hypothetical protein